MYPDNMVEVHVRAYLYRWHTKDEHEVSGMNYEVGPQSRLAADASSAPGRCTSWRLICGMLQRRPVRQG